MEKILVAYDGTESCRKALDTAAQLGKAFGAKIGVVSVIPHRAGRFPVDPWDDADVHAKKLLDARDELRQLGLEAELLEPAGDPARMIETMADRGGYDTIVVGSRNLGALERLFQGSVSEHVATHAHATVVVAR
jgi:nucleotide-binding universal stress UspA family protein